MRLGQRRLALRPRDRLHAAADFRRLLRGGIRIEGRLFVLLARRSHCGHPRLGLAASRKVGGAVARNRAKRLLREAFRRAEARSGAWDLLLIAKRALVGQRLHDVESEYRLSLERLRQRTRGAGPAAGR